VDRLLNLKGHGYCIRERLQSLNLVDRRGQLNELIARNIIELATCGVHDAGRLSAGVLAIYKPAAE
jgi:hypothetical protein